MTPPSGTGLHITSDIANGRRAQAGKPRPAAVRAAGTGSSGQRFHDRRNAVRRANLRIRIAFRLVVVTLPECIPVWCD
jgi:hypothetical protein